MVAVSAHESLADMILDRLKEFGPALRITDAEPGQVEVHITLTWPLSDRASLIGGSERTAEVPE
jgi:hypothetical protein